MSDSTQHTQGLLKACGVNIYAEDHTTFVASTCAGNTCSSSADANARRLVACWNACDGTSTKFIEYLASLPHNAIASYEHIQTENATLRAEVERLRGDAVRYQWLRNAPWNWDADGTPRASPWVVSGDGHADATPISTDKLDAAIDAARAALKGGA